MLQICCGVVLFFFYWRLRASPVIAGAADPLRASPGVSGDRWCCRSAPGVSGVSGVSGVFFLLLICTNNFFEKNKNNALQVRFKVIL